jgi:hypothetical protein
VHLDGFYSLLLLAVYFHLTAKKYAAETKSSGKVHFSLKPAPITSLPATALLTDGIHSLFNTYDIFEVIHVSIHHLS